MAEFKDFLPEAAPPLNANPPGMVGILPQPPAGAGMPSGSFAQVEPPAAEKSAKTQNRRRKRPEKEPVAPPKAASGRVSVEPDYDEEDCALTPTGQAAKRAKTTNQRTEPVSPKFSPYQVPHSPQPVNMHVHPIPPSMHQPGIQSLPARPPSVGPIGGPTQSVPDEYLFFERAKKALDSGGTYEEFLKLLNLFSRDIIDMKTLVERSEVFLGDGDLLTQFKEMINFEDTLGREEGPPGSLRTAAPDYYAALPPMDGHGPSYRRLPESVSMS